MEPIPNRKFPTLEKYKWNTALVQAVIPSTTVDDIASECEVIIIHSGKEIRFWEYSDNIRVKPLKKV